MYSNASDNAVCLTVDGMYMPAVRFLLGIATSALAVFVAGISPERGVAGLTADVLLLLLLLGTPPAAAAAEVK
jgi:hypothetical protein